MSAGNDTSPEALKSILPAQKHRTRVGSPLLLDPCPAGPDLHQILPVSLDLPAYADFPDARPPSKLKALHIAVVTSYFQFVAVEAPAFLQDTLRNLPCPNFTLQYSDP